MRNIILIGMPGCGKTTFGKRLAQELGLSFFDADEVLEAREKRTIKSFFAESEDAFRAAETRTLSFLAELEGAVIATGGGAVKRPVNMEMLKTKGCVVFIDRAPERILGDIQGDSRPLLAQDKQRIFNLYQERINLYHQHADFEAGNNGQAEDTFAKLKEIAQQIQAMEQ